MQRITHFKYIAYIEKENLYDKSALIFETLYVFYGGNVIRFLCSVHFLYLFIIDSSEGNYYSIHRHCALAIYCTD